MMKLSPSLLALAIAATFIGNAPALLANDYESNKTLVNFDDDFNSDINNDEYGDDFDDTLEDFYGDEDFVSIATGNKVLISKAPSVATVITAEQIQRMGALTVAEALENVPGLHVYPSPFNRLNNSFSIRGIHTDQNPQILFLINGLPIREEYTGARPQTFKMPIHSVARIEVIRGPGSAVYGADAYSGVINVITHELTQLSGAHYGASYGSFNSSNAWYQNSFSLSTVNIGFALETLKSDGDKDRIMTRDLQSVFDDVIGTSSSLSPTSLNTKFNILDFRVSAESNDLKANFWYWNNKDAGQGAGAAQAIDPTGLQDTSIYQFDASYDWKISTWDTSIRYDFYKMEDKAQFSVLPPGAILPIGEDGNLDLAAPVGIGLFVDGYLGNPQPEEKLNLLDFTAISNDFDEHKIRIGMGVSQRKLTAREEKNFGPGVIDTVRLAELFANGELMVIDGTLTDLTNTPYIFIKDVERTNLYLSFQDQWKFANDWELTTGIRFDDYDDFGSTINPRVALVWEMSQKTTTKLLYGRAFRAPAFDTLYAINNPVGLGNPNLEPETIDTVEFTVNQHLRDNLTWSFNLYAYESNDLIEFVPDQGTTTTTAQNEKNQQGYGFESELEWQNSLGLWQFNYSWQHSEDKDTGIETSLAPQQLFHALYSQQISEKVSFNAKLNWVGQRDRELGDLRPELDNYSILDVAIHWALDAEQTWKLSLIGKNILDENAYEPSHPLVPDVLGPISDYPIQGSSFYLQIAKKM